MSHFSTIRTRLANRGYLEAALGDLGLRVEEGSLEIRDFAGTRTPVEIRVKVDGGRHAIGFRRVGDAFELVADWYGIRQLDRATFPSRLAQRYAYHATRAKLEQQGFDMVEEKFEETGQIRIVLRRMA